MLSVTLLNNKRNYLRYNDWRKQQFVARSPKDANVILYLLPWLLNVNHPAVPGFIRDKQDAFKVFNIENTRDIFFQRISVQKNVRGPG